jgi:L-threonylcarbamoyladenylate synthase
MDARLVDDAVEAIRAGRPVVLPTDTVYGLCATPYRAQPVEQLYRLKGRSEQHPLALLASDLDMLFECVPELRGRAGSIARVLLPGPLTLVFPNPAWRFPWLSGARPETIGVRVPELTRDAKAIIHRIGAVAATSANLSGGPDPKILDEVPDEIRAGAAVVIDGGELPGIPSTVVDLTGPEPQIIREGAQPAAEVLERLGQLV